MDTNNNEETQQKEVSFNEVVAEYFSNSPTTISYTNPEPESHPEISCTPTSGIELELNGDCISEIDFESWHNFKG